VKVGLAILLLAVVPETDATRRVWIIYQDGDFHSDVLRKEWKREWCHSFLREEVKRSFDVRWVPLEQTQRRVDHVPMLVLELQDIPLTSCGSSGAALQELRDVLIDFRDEEYEEKWETENDE
jgi:hypothetical protein